MIFVLLTHYVSPSIELLSLLKSWLTKLLPEQTTNRLVSLAITGLKTPRVHEASNRYYYDWSPSLYEIDAVLRDKKVEV